MTFATAMLLLLAITSLQLSRASQASVMPFIATGMGVFVTLLFGRWAFARLMRFATVRTRRRVNLLMGVAATAIVGMTGLLSALPMAGEETVLIALITLAAVIFGCNGDRSSQQRTALLSVIAILFSLPGIDESYRLPIILAVAGLGCLWLILSANAVAKDRCTWAYAGAALAVVTGGCLLAHRMIKPTDGDNPWYAALVPTSGGDGAGDANARRGTGDGPDEISGDSADSIGFDRSDTFSESGKDGLYDLWVEAYGEPVKQSDQQKMVGLKPKDVTIAKGSDRENLKVGRSFQMQRQRKKSVPRPGAEVAADARVWVKGSLPVYLPLATFHDFDGTSWQVVEHGKPSIPARKMGDLHWMEILNRPISPSFSGTNEHEIRIGNLGGDVLPMSAIVERFRMGRVSRPDFFASTRSGLVRLAHRDVPAGATLNVVSKRVSPSLLVDVEPALPIHSDSSVLSTYPIGDPVSLLAAEWGADRSRGWRQIEQVVSRLRAHVTLNQNVPDLDGHASSSDPVHELLFVSRNGADFQIASAAVMLLRSLDYPTRLVSGLYASENDVDERSGFVALDADDVHFWIEVRLADGTWITIDPSPGYPMLNFPTPPGEWLTSVWRDARFAVSNHAVAFVLSIAGVTGIVLFRRQLIDAVATALCHLRGCDSRRVMSVIELRARLLRRPRPPWMPAGVWIGSLDDGGGTSPFVEQLNRSLYGEGHPGLTDIRTDNAKALLAKLTLRAMRKSKKEMA